MINTYAMAYTEVLEILKYIPKEEYNKIPKEKIEFYEKNKDKNYKYVFDNSIPLEEQKISRKTNGIIVSLFLEYFANSKQKEEIKKKLNDNEEKYQKEIRDKYNPNEIFKNKQNKQIIQESYPINIEKKKSIFTRLKEWLIGKIN